MNNRIQLLDVVALTSDLPQHNLNCGEIGTVVECYPDGVFEVEWSLLRKMVVPMHLFHFGVIKS